MPTPSAAHPDFLAWLCTLLLAACATASPTPDAPSSQPEPAGVDPSLVLASRGGSTHPASGTTAILGRGFDSLQGEVLGDCVASAKAISFAGANDHAGATSDLVVRYARTREELANALGVSVEASASFGFFGASARAKWAHRDDITSDTSFLVISNEVVNDTQSLETYRLSDSAEAVLREGGVDAFYRMCGDQFIAARVTGGSLHVVVEIRNASQSFSKQMSAGAGVKAWVFSASGEMTEEAKRALASEEHHIEVFQSGGLGHPERLQQLVSFAYGFRSLVTGANAKHAAPISFVTAPYSVVATATQINIPSLTQQRRRLTELAVWHGDAKTRRRDLIDAEAGAGTCKEKEARFSRATEQVEGAIRAIEVEAQACVEDPMRACGGGRARPMKKGLHLDLIRECTPKAAENDPLLAEKRAAAKREAELQAALRDANKGDTGGSPCAVWEVRSVKPKFGNNAAWIDVTVTAAAGGSMRAKEERKLFEDSGWAINPELRVPTGASIAIAGKVKFERGCGFWDGGPCRRGDEIVSAHFMDLTATIPGGTVEAEQFTLRFECIEATRSSAGRRRAPATARPRPPVPVAVPRTLHRGG